MALTVKELQDFLTHFNGEEEILFFNVDGSYTEVVSMAVILDQLNGTEKLLGLSNSLELQEILGGAPSSEDDSFH